VTDAFDSDVLIYAVVEGHPLGRRVKALFSTTPPGELVGTGSVVLVPEILSKPIRDRRFDEQDELKELLARLELQGLTRASAQLSASVAAKYSLQAADAIHLAAALEAGADRFITNNRRDFPQTIEEVDVVYPDDLPDPEETDHG
jgi:predicted nucleic acid-binding protein